MQFTPKHLTRIREIWEAFSQAYNSYSDESTGSKVMGPDQFVVAASQLMEEAHSAARREALKEMDWAWKTYAKHWSMIRAGKFSEKMFRDSEEEIEKLRQEYLQPN